MVLYELETGSSDDGHHAIESFLACPRKARLDAEKKKEWRESGAPFTLENSYYHIGVLFHAYQDLFVTGQIHSPKDLDDVEFVTDDRDRQVIIDYEANVEAKRLTAAWMTTYPHNLFGTALQTEFKLPHDQRVLDVVGRERFSGRIDLATKLDKKGAVRLANITEQFAMHRLELDPGIYVIDWKTSSSAYGSLGDEYGNSFQIVGYMAAWNALFPKQQVTGALVVVAVKTKTPKFIFIRRGPPTPHELEALRTRHATERIFRAHPVLNNWANTGKCFPFLLKPCAHWISGACKRS